MKSAIFRFAGGGEEEKKKDAGMDVFPAFGSTRVVSGLRDATMQTADLLLL